MLDLQPENKKNVLRYVYYLSASYHLTVDYRKQLPGTSQNIFATKQMYIMKEYVSQLEKTYLLTSCSVFIFDR